MQFNYYFLKALSVELSKNLIGKNISAVFSQNKDELILCFNGQGEAYYIKANLDSQSSLLSFPHTFARAKKNSIDLFTEINDLKVVGIRQFKNERSFSIQFTEEYELLFKLHGRHSNILLFQNNTLKSLFKKNIEKDHQLDLNTLDRELDQSNQAIREAEFDLFKVFPTFDKHIKNHLKSLGFYVDPEPETKLTKLNLLLDQLNDSNYYVLKESQGLRLFKPDEEFELFASPRAASNHLARVFFTNHGFSQLKSKLLTQVNKEIKKSESYINQNENKLAEIENRRGYDELANILMANLHLKVNTSAKEIELLDFYANEQIKIKLKPNQSLQLNAENLYRKAKNQSKEIKKLKENIGAKKKVLESLNEKVSTILAIKDIKLLKAFEKPTSGQTKAPLPFMEFEIHGFQVLAGKNAKNNDLLTQKFARKDDLWLHARDVSGSHVIIRNPNGLNIPNHVIEKVAQLAAWHSKRKSDTLCPVIYTPKKFVRKPKGALPGQVLLSKEQVVLVKPERNL
ncbi:MAG: NFACT RNA binding domain-containing protein [Reichenbachiella sp.]|uniref:NFACT RNA binding domain-containing protein n=1 Tax=Reichenbachiella sp. TaxID=2184521 RepID=UPI00329A6677